VFWDLVNWSTIVVHISWRTILYTAKLQHGSMCRSAAVVVLHVSQNIVGVDAFLSHRIPGLLHVKFSHTQYAANGLVFQVIETHFINGHSMRPNQLTVLGEGWNFGNTVEKQRIRLHLVCTIQRLVDQNDPQTTGWTFGQKCGGCQFRIGCCWITINLQSPNRSLFSGIQSASTFSGNKTK